MKISASVQNREGSHQIQVKTDAASHSIEIPPKSGGPGSSINGGELLFLALATCYCNDVYREAAKRGIRVDQVEVDVEGDFGGVGEPGKNITYRAKVTAHGSETEIRDLLEHTDRVAEIQNTLRVGTPVSLGQVEVVLS